MTRVRVTVPATSANLGPGLDSMALALGLHNVVELSEIDHGLEVNVHGEGVNSLSRDHNNAVVKAAVRVFRETDYAPSGLRVDLRNNIPSNIGLGSKTASLLGGIVAANVLLGNPLDQAEMLYLAADMEGRPNSVSAALYGGLVLSITDDNKLIHASVPVAPMQVIIVWPQITEATKRQALPQSVLLSDATFNVGRAMLVVQALTTGDFDLLSHTMQDRLHQPARSQTIPGFEKAVDAARQQGAAAIAISGSGPALIVFAPADHDQIVKAMTQIFSDTAQIDARTWILPVDTQGVSISEMAARMDFGEQQRKPIPASDHPAPSPDHTHQQNNDNPDRPDQKHGISPPDEIISQLDRLGTSISSPSQSSSPDDRTHSNSAEDNGRQ